MRKIFVTYYVDFLNVHNTTRVHHVLVVTGLPVKNKIKNKIGTCVYNNIKL